MLICDVFQIKISTQNDTALHFMMGSSLHNVCAQVVLTRVTQRTGKHTCAGRRCRMLPDCFLMTLKTEQAANKKSVKLSFQC